jgi:hypothetical protein
MRLIDGLHVSPRRPFRRRSPRATGNVPETVGGWWWGWKFGNCHGNRRHGGGDVARAARDGAGEQWRRIKRTRWRASKQKSCAIAINTNGARRGENAGPDLPLLSGGESENLGLALAKP